MPPNATKAIKTNYQIWKKNTAGQEAQVEDEKTTQRLYSNYQLCSGFGSYASRTLFAATVCVLHQS